MGLSFSLGCQDGLQSPPFKIATPPGSSRAEYPGFISLITLKPPAAVKKFCSAVRIAPNFLLTSASCLSTQPTPRRPGDHHIVSIQYISAATAQTDTFAVTTLSPSQILAVDTFPQYTRDSTIPFLALHDLAIITTTAPPSAQGEFIRLASQDITLAELTDAAALRIYSLDIATITSVLSDGYIQLPHGMGVLAPDLFGNFKTNINKIDPQQSTSPQNVRKRQALLLNQLEYLTTLFADHQRGLFMLRSSSPRSATTVTPPPMAAGPPTLLRLCSHDAGGAVTIIGADGEQQLVGILGDFGRRAQLEYNFLINPQKHMIYTKNPVNVLLNSMICPDFTSVSFVPPYHDWINQMISMRMLSLTDDGTML